MRDKLLGGAAVAIFLYVVASILVHSCRPKAPVPPPPMPVLEVTTDSLPQGNIGQPYSVQLTARNGVQPYFWRVKEGRLPAGLTLSPSGLLSGVPTEGGSFDFVVEVTDSSGTPQVARARFST